MTKQVYQPPAWGQNSRSGLLFGIALAALLFLLLPLAQFFSAVEDEEDQPRRVDTATPPPPPPPPPPPQPEEPEPASMAATPSPAPAEAEPPPLSLREMRLALDPEPGQIRGDFAVDFDVDAAGMGEVDAFEIADVDQPPRAVSTRQPRYPPELRRARIGGSVTLVFIVETDGSVSNLEVESSDHHAFEQPAREAVRNWRFTPGERDGQRIRTIVRQTLDFTVQ